MNAIDPPISKMLQHRLRDHDLTCLRVVWQGRRDFTVTDSVYPSRRTRKADGQACRHDGIYAVTHGGHPYPIQLPVWCVITLEYDRCISVLERLPDPSRNPTRRHCQIGLASRAEFGESLHSCNPTFYPYCKGCRHTHLLRPSACHTLFVLRANVKLPALSPYKSGRLLMHRRCHLATCRKVTFKRLSDLKVIAPPHEVFHFTLQHYVRGLDLLIPPPFTKLSTLYMKTPNIN